MSWFDTHVDGLLARWAEGTLSPRQSTRLLRHAHTCERCARHYERLVRASRLLERGEPHTPTDTELTVLADAGLAAALAAAEPERARSRWPSLAMAGGMLAAVSLAVLVLIRPEENDAWRARGTGQPTRAVLRVFCAVRQRPLRELEPSQACPPGAQLAFAVGADSPLSHVAVAVRGPRGAQRIEGPFPITGRPGAEQPLETTLSVQQPPGEAEVIAAFAPSPREALAALREEEHREAVVLRLPVRIEDTP
ncbi:hypothetical protein [Cystobacter ferrugineus]|uniref:Zinc-finger domain-containing protein n=1 Tax=Cystobacter ferrugineus TaxID=83449 RepID=A0A1L9AYW5_9BACT|nr:hypothetical protein [Cystobacter ferrugineus]OJH35200.1 hypothetical protein BON30_39785 [Cystobacter ferrugineus]